MYGVVNCDADHHEWREMLKEADLSSVGLAE
jgi:hypothetical protein